MQVSVDNSLDQGTSDQGLSKLLLAKASANRGIGGSPCDVQQWDGVQPRFSHGGQCPGKAGPRNRKYHAGFTSDPRPPTSHEAGAHFVRGDHGANSALAQRLKELKRLGAGQAKDAAYSAQLERLDDSRRS